MLTSFLHSHHPDFQPQNTPVEAHFLGSFGPLLQRCQTLCAQAHLLHNTKAKHNYYTYAVNICSCMTHYIPVVLCFPQEVRLHMLLILHSL